MHLGLIPVNKLSNLFKSFSNLSLYVGYDNKCLCISLSFFGNFIQLIDTIWKTGISTVYMILAQKLFKQFQPLRKQSTWSERNSL